MFILYIASVMLAHYKMTTKIKHISGIVCKNNLTLFVLCANLTDIPDLYFTSGVAIRKKQKVSLSESKPIIKKIHALTDNLLTWSIIPKGLNK